MSKKRSVNVYFDTEFTFLNYKKMELISIGMVADGMDDSFYMYDTWYHSLEASDFVKNHVFPNVEFKELSQETTVDYFMKTDANIWNVYDRFWNCYWHKFNEDDKNVSVENIYAPGRNIILWCLHVLEKADAEIINFVSDVPQYDALLLNNAVNNPVTEYQLHTLLNIFEQITSMQMDGHKITQYEQKIIDMLQTSFKGIQAPKSAVEDFQKREKNFWKEMNTIIQNALHPECVYDLNQDIYWYMAANYLKPGETAIQTCSVYDAFDINREDFLVYVLYGKLPEGNKHNALYDAKVIKAIFNELHK